MARARLTEKQTEWLRTRQRDDEKAIVGYTAATEALAQAQARREQLVAEQDKLVALAEVEMERTAEVVLARLGEDGARALGIELPAKARRQARRSQAANTNSMAERREVTW